MTLVNVMQSQQCWHHSIWFALPGQDFEAFEDICFRFWNWSSVEILNFLMEIGVKNFWYDLKAVALVNGDSTQSFGLLSLWQCFFDCLLERLQGWDGFQMPSLALQELCRKAFLPSFWCICCILHLFPFIRRWSAAHQEAVLCFRTRTACSVLYHIHIIVPHIIVPHIM